MLCVVVGQSDCLGVFYVYEMQRKECEPMYLVAMRQQSRQEKVRIMEGGGGGDTGKPGALRNAGFPIWNRTPGNIAYL